MVSYLDVPCSLELHHQLSSFCTTFARDKISADQVADICKVRLLEVRNLVDFFRIKTSYCYILADHISDIPPIVFDEPVYRYVSSLQVPNKHPQAT